MFLHKRVDTTEKGDALNSRSFDYRLRMDTIQTTCKTLNIDDPLFFRKNADIATTFSKVSNQSSLAAVTAQKLKDRGPVILMHSRPDYAWSLAKKLQIAENRLPEISENITLVQNYLEIEFGFFIVILVNE